MIWDLVVVYLGFWCGIILGLIARDELKHWFFRYFRINLTIVYALFPLILLWNNLLTTSVLFLLGFPLGSEHVSKYLKGRKIKNKKEMLKKAFIQTSFYFLASIIALLVLIFV